MTVTVVTPTPCHHELREIEITANPTSAKPDWIIRRTQHTLVLSPAEACAQTRFMVVLDLADPDSDAADVLSLPCVGGTSVQVTRNEHTRIAAFAKGISRLVVPDLLATDASWVVATPATGDIWAGGMTNLWLNGSLQCLASTPVEIALLDGQCIVVAKQPSWVSLRKPADMTDIQ